MVVAPRRVAARPGVLGHVVEVVEPLWYSKEPAPGSVERTGRIHSIERRHDVLLHGLWLDIRDLVYPTARPLDALDPLRLIQPENVDLGPVRQVDDQVRLAGAAGVCCAERQRF